MHVGSQHSIRNLSSPTRDWTHTRCVGSTESPTLDHQRSAHMPLLFARANLLPVILIPPLHLHVYSCFSLGKQKKRTVKYYSLIWRGREGREKEAGESEKSRKIGGSRKGSEEDRKRERETVLLYEKNRMLPNWKHRHSSKTLCLQSPVPSDFKTLHTQIGLKIKCFPPTSHCCSPSFNLLYVTGDEALPTACLFS